MLPDYVPLIILGAIAVGFAVFTLAVSQILGRPRPTPAKSSTFECGVPPIGNARQRFPIKFYLVCMIFILFDVDAAFLYPWALVFRDLGVLRVHRDDRLHRRARGGGHLRVEGGGARLVAPIS